MRRAVSRTIAIIEYTTINCIGHNFGRTKPKCSIFSRKPQLASVDLTHNNPTPYLAREVTTFHACRAEANLALCDQVLLGSGVIAAARVYTCRAHRRFIAHLRGQHHPRPVPILDWLRHISLKGLGHHCRPCRRLSRSHQAERTHRRHGPARECHQGRLARASGSDAALNRRAEAAHLSADAPFVAV